MTDLNRILQAGFSDEHNNVFDDLDPDCNINNDLCINECNYFSEDTFNELLSTNSVTSKDLSILHLNIRSLPKNISNLQNYLECLNIDFTILGLSETWHNANTIDVYNLMGYNCVNRYRENRIGGGLSIYVKNNIEFFQRSDLELCTEENECIFIEIDRSCVNESHNVILGLFYRPPNTNLPLFIDNINSILSKIKNEKKTCLLMGDFNIDLLKYQEHDNTKHFLDDLFTHSYFPLITKPTRITEYSATLIDNIYCNSLAKHNFINGLLSTDISDHLPIFTILKSNLTDSQSPEYTYQRNVTDQKLNEFKETIASCNWDNVLNNNNAQDAYTSFLNIIQDAYNRSFPLRKVKNNQSKKKHWLSDSLKKCIKEKNKLYLKSKSVNSLYNIIKYKKYKTALTKTLRNAEKLYYQEKFEQYKHNLKYSWGMIKKLIGINQYSSINKLFYINGEKITDNTEIANQFNKYFVKIGSTLAAEIDNTSTKSPKHYMQNPNELSLFLQPATENEIKSIITSFKKIVRVGMV